jgi:hypothetical protein
MAGIQLTCPHCCSTLNFGQAVQAGAVLPCLICNRTFTVRPAAAAASAPQAQVAPSALAARRAGTSVPPQAQLAPPRATGAPPNAAAVAKPSPARSTSAAPRDKAPPQGAPSASSGTAGRAAGGLVLVTLALILLAGLGYLFWTNVLGERLARSDKDASSVWVEGPSADKENKSKDKATAVPPVIDKKEAVESPTKDGGPLKKKEGKPAIDSGDDDVGDFKKPEKPDKPAPLTEVKTKQPDDEKKKLEKGPVVQVPVAAPPIAPGVDAERIDAAIALGVKFLKARQAADGSWVDSANGPAHAVGIAALGGLALLECKLPADDSAVQKVAERVRGGAAGLRKNYDASLAILFLDRLGDPKDRELIQTLALRLIAVQTEYGGWDYECPTLSAKEAQEYETFLKVHWPWSPARPRPAGFSVKPPGAAADGPKKDGKKVEPAKFDAPSINLRDLPLNLLIWNKGRTKFAETKGDNSNTQFALLGLWTARRHDIPAECPLLLTYRRFQVTQAGDGGWSYGFMAPPAGGGLVQPGGGLVKPGGGLVPPGGGLVPPGGGLVPPGGGLVPPGGGLVQPGGGLPGGLGGGSTNTMTCAGLLGLAVGSGALPSTAKGKDQAIEKGLNALAQHIGQPAKDADARPAMQNMYFLWSVERVGVLFDLKTIGGKDWYAWGAQILLANQHGDGHWLGTQYIGRTDIIDTCFALLFLKQANLAPDLTESLRLNMAIRDPGSK